MDHQIHYLKAWPEFFKPVWEGAMKFEYRKDDRGFVTGDTLVIQEWEPATNIYTGRDVLAVVTCIVRECPGLPDGYCIMGIEPFGIRDGEIQATNGEVD